MSAAHEQALRVLADAYLIALTPGQRDAYLVAVADLDPEAVRAAVVELIQTGGRFIPRPSELRRAVLRLDDEGVPDPGEAWEEVAGELQRVGSWGSPVFSHPLVAKAVGHVGGWLALCRSEVPGADRARFLDAYQRLVERRERELLVAPALGALGGGLLHELDPADPADPDDDDPRWN